jgi:D-alanine-D-alanine ligase
MGIEKRAVILHSHVPADAAMDEADTLLQLNGVQGALTVMGFSAGSLPFSLDMKTVSERLREDRPSFVFNLVESVEGKGGLIHLAPALLEHLDIKYTGCPADAVFLTTNKIAAKRIMRRCGLPTPDWVSRAECDAFSSGARYIIKPVSEDASTGLDDSSVASFESHEELRAALFQKAEACGREHFAERFVDGREFNISIIGNRGEPEILPPAEMRFTGYEQRGKIKIVGYKSKWEEGSFEFSNTSGVFDFGRDDELLIVKLRKIAEECWGLFHLRGYARVDFRVDGDNEPWILEVNANPCITPSASGFLNAAKRAGLDFQGIVERIIAEI